MSEISLASAVEKRIGVEVGVQVADLCGVRKDTAMATFADTINSKYIQLLCRVSID